MRALSFVLGIAAVAALLILLSPHASAATIVPAGVISQDTTWTPQGSPYWVQGSIFVRGTAGPDGVTTLTVQPGTTVMFAQGASMEIGYCCDANLPGQLVANGTAAAPILFTSNQTVHTHGFWGPMQFSTYARASSLRNVTISYGGYSTANLYLNGYSPAIVDSVISEGSQQGIYISGTDVALQNTTVSNLDQYGIYVASGGLNVNGGEVDGTVQYPVYAPADATFVGMKANANAQQRILLWGGTFTTRDARWGQVVDNTGAVVPYLLQSSATFYGTAGSDLCTTLTIDAGAMVRMTSAAQLTFGTSSASLPGGAIQAKGTAALPVIFTSDQGKIKTAGYWARLQFERYAGPSAIDNATLEYGGYGGVGTLYFDYGSAAVHNSLVDRSLTYGAYVVGSSPSFTGSSIDHTQSATYALYHATNTPLLLDNLRLVNTTGRPLFMMPSDQLVNLVVGGDSIPQVDVSATDLTVDNTWPALAEPYRIVGSFRIYGQDGSDAATTLTIQAGTTVQMAQYSILYVGYPYSNLPGGGLVTQGTSLAPVLFTSDQAAGQQTPGFWGRVEFDTYLTPAATVLDGVTFAYGGYGGVGTLYLAGGSPNLVGVTVDHSLTWGIYDGVNQALTIAHATITNTQGTPLGMYPQVHLGQIDISSATVPRVEVFSSDLTVDNEWPALAVPYHIGSSMRVYGTDGPDGSTTLTIDAGSRIEIARYVSLYVGYPYSNLPGGGITTLGTAGKPVVITSDEPAPKSTTGYWGYVEFDTYLTPASTQMSYTTFEYGGYGGAGTIYLNGGHPVFDHVTVDHSQTWGVYDPQNLPYTITGLAITNTQGKPIGMYPQVTLGDITTSGSTVPMIEVFCADLTVDNTWPDLGIPYHLPCNMRVYGNDGADATTTLTLAPGVDVQMGRYCTLYIGYPYQGYGNGGLIAAGTSASPITITGDGGPGNPGWWGRIEFDDTVTPGITVLSHVTVQEGGYGSGGAVYVQRAPVSIADSTFFENAPYAVDLYDTATALTRVDVTSTSGSGAIGVIVSGGGTNVATLDGVNIIGTTGVPLRIWPDTNILGVSFFENDVNGIEVNAAAVSHDTTWRNWGAPYMMLGDLNVWGNDGDDGATILTLEPGVVVQMPLYSNVYVGNNYYAQGGAIVSQGNAEAPVVFTARAAPPAAGSWYNFQLGQYASAAQMDLSNVRIEYDYYGLYLSSTPPMALHDISIQHTSSYGLFLSSVTGSTFDRIEANDTPYGLYEQYASNVGIHDSSFGGTGYSGYLYSVSGSEITGTRFWGPNDPFIVYYSNGNLFANDAFTRDDGVSPVYEYGSANTWNFTPTPGTNILGGPMLGGNLYNDYAGVDFSNPSDGLGDTLAPYAIPGSSSADAHPLADPSRWIPDLKPPTTQLQLSGTLHPSGWYITPVAITVTAQDDISGVASSATSLDGAAYVDYAGPLSVSAEGQHIVLARSTDKAGNVGEPASASFGVDITPPSVAIAVDPGFDDVCFRADASDGASGLASLAYTITLDGALAHDGHGAPIQNIPISPGQHVCAGLHADGLFHLSVDASDVVGNLGSAGADVLLDALPPVLSITAPTAGDTYVGETHASGALVPALEPGVALVVKETMVTADASDAGSGVARGELWIDGELAQTDTHAPFRWWALGDAALGHHNIVVRAFDRAGHVAQDSRQVMLISNAAEGVKDLNAEIGNDGSCVSVGAAMKVHSSAVTDIEADGTIARSIANLTVPILDDADALVPAPGGKLTGGIVGSACHAGRVPAHFACGVADAVDITIDLTPLPAHLHANALHADACTDPAVTNGSSWLTDLSIREGSTALGEHNETEPNHVIPIRLSMITGPASGGRGDPLVGVVILNEQHDGADECRWREGAALRVIVFDPATSFSTVAAETVVSRVSVAACKMTPILGLVSDPVGPGVVPGSAVSARATAVGPLAGQRYPTGDVSFTLASVPVSDSPLVASVAQSDSTTGTLRVGGYCWRADYPGDAYYYPGSIMDKRRACFATGRQAADITLLPTPNTTAVVPYTGASAFATVTGAPGWPTPTGAVVFILCPPAAFAPGSDVAMSAALVCWSGASYQVGSAPALSAGQAASDALVSTGAVGEYCWGALYTGDAFYLPGTLAFDHAHCFTTVRQVPTVTVLATAQGPFLPGSSTAGAATVSGARPATGTVRFFACSPREVEPGVGCVSGGTPIGAPITIVSGGATSAPFTSTVFVGDSCIRAEYSGDAYYLPGAAVNIGAACYHVTEPCADLAGAGFGAAETAVGSYVAIGAPSYNGKGAVCIFDGATGAYVTKVVSPGASGAHFGSVLAANGGELLVGAPDTGAGTVYRVTPATGAILGSFSGPHTGARFGAAIAGASGSRLVIGAPGDDTNASDAGIAYVTSSTGAIQTTLWNPTPDAGDAFGSAVASVSSFAIVGAPNDDAANTNAGAAHVLALADGSFVVTMLSPSQTAGDLYGSAIAAIDASSVVIGAPGANAAYAHDAASGSMLRPFTDPASGAGDRFGASVGVLSGRVLVGAPGTANNAGAAYLFHPLTGALLDTFADPTPTANDQLGASVAGASSNAIVGAPGDDQTRTDGGAAQWWDGASAPSLASVAGDATGAEAGASVATDGTLVAIGMPGSDRVEVHDINGAIVSVIADPNPAAGDRFGAAVAIANGKVLVGAPYDDTAARDAGAAYVFDATSGSRLFNLTRASPRFDDFFGAAVAIDGNSLIVGAPGDDAGAPGAGAVYVFDATTGARVRQIVNPTPAFHDDFGAALAVASGQLAIGAPGDDAAATDAGAVHVYDLSSGARLRTLTTPGAATGDGLGTSVAYVNGLLAAGAPGDDHGATDSGTVQLWRASDGAFQRAIARPHAQLNAAFGSSLAALGSRLIVGAPHDDAGAPGAGAAYVVDPTNGAHLRTLLAPTPTPNADFGAAVAGGAGRAIVGAPGIGAGEADAYDAPRATPDLSL